jgi:hypothetical protein
MASYNLGDESAQRVMNVRQRLFLTRLHVVRHEIDGVALMQRHPNFRVPLETTNTGAMPGARVKDDNRPTIAILAPLKAVVAIGQYPQ